MCCHPGVVAHRGAGRAPASSRMRVKLRAAADWHTHRGLLPAFVQSEPGSKPGWLGPGHCARRYRTRGNRPGVIEIRGANAGGRVPRSECASADGEPRLSRPETRVVGGFCDSRGSSQRGWRWAWQRCGDVSPLAGRPRSPRFLSAYRRWLALTLTCCASPRSGRCAPASTPTTPTT